MKSAEMKSKFGIALAAGALFSFCQLITANAATIMVSPLSVDFGPVAIGSSGTAVVTATALTDPNFHVTSWTPAIFNGSIDIGALVDVNNPVNNCGSGSTVCAVELIFSPHILGVANSNLEFLFTEANDAGVILSGGPVVVTLTGLGTAATPLPAALPLFATGLGVLGLLGWRRKQKAQTAA